MPSAATTSSSCEQPGFGAGCRISSRIGGKPSRGSGPRERRRLRWAGALAAGAAAAIICLSACVELRASGPATPPSRAPSTGAPPAFGGRPQLVLAALTDPEFVAAGRAAGAQSCLFIYQQFGETNGKYDEAKLRRMLREKIPADWSGYAMLDFEGHWLEFLEAEPGTPEFERGEKAMLRLMEVAREERPNARWSFYGVPSLRFFVGDEKGRTVGWDKGSERSKERAMEKGRRAQGLVDACDWVSPSVYDGYFDATHPAWKAAGPAHVRAEVALARELGRGKPVLPTVWHRVHPSNKTDGLRLLPDEEFIEGQVRAALDAGAAGVVWWSGDAVMARQGQLQRRWPQEFAGVDTDEPAAVSAYLRQLHIQKLKALQAAMQ